MVLYALVHPGSPRGCSRSLRLASGDGEVAFHTAGPCSSKAALPAARRGVLGVTFLGAVSMRRRRADEGGDREIAELAALADGSLAPERRVALEARVAASSELADRLAEQQRAVALTRSAAEGVEAPAALRARIEAHEVHAEDGHPVARPGRCRYDRRAGRRRGGGRERARFGHLRGELPRCPCIDHLSPGATGEATLTKTSSGWRIELDATGLPRLDAGASTRRGCETPPACSFRSGRSTRAVRVTLWAGVSPKDFTTLTVTRERADGDQTSSGEKVLVGTVDTGG